MGPQRGLELHDRIGETSLTCQGHAQIDPHRDILQIYLHRTTQHGLRLGWSIGAPQFSGEALENPQIRGLTAGRLLEGRNGTGVLLASRKQFPKRTHGSVD